MSHLTTPVPQVASVSSSLHRHFRQRHGLHQPLRRGLLPVAIATLLTFVSSAAALAAPTAPAARPSAAFSFTASQVKSGAPVQFSYRTANLPSGSEVYLEQQSGPSWAYVEPLRPGNRVATAPALPAGDFVYRVQVLHAGHVVTLSPARHLTVSQTAPPSSGCTVCDWVTAAAAVLGLIIDF